MEKIRERLLGLRDEGYREFHSALIPNVDKERVIGVRVPALRALARELKGTPEREEFLKTLPHFYYEEQNLHGLLLEQEPDFTVMIGELERFLPTVDNWSTCDLLRPRLFRSHREELLPILRRWLDSEHLYQMRFALEMLMVHFLEEDFSPEYLDWAAGVSTGEYYGQMMQAWYFATALAFRWEEALPWLEPGRLDPWVRAKTIQKGLESYRIPEEHKAVLRGLRRRTSH